nr:MAG TPA: hypothetical protein [Caudoviricetes sp.]
MWSVSGSQGRFYFICESQESQKLLINNDKEFFPVALSCNHIC